MLARLLPIISLALMAALGYLLYTNGTFERIFNPSVSVVVAERALPPGETISRDRVALRSRAIRGLADGAIAFPEGADLDTAMAALGGQRPQSAIAAGTVLKMSLLGKRRDLFALRAIAAIAQGAAPTAEAVEVAPLERVAGVGVVVFRTESDASAYLDRINTLVARSAIAPGDLLSVADLGTRTSKLVALAATRNFGAGEQLAAAGLRVRRVDSDSVPNTTIVFPARGPAQAFLEEVDNLLLTQDVASGDILTASLLAKSRLAESPDGMPRTLRELEAYARANPGTVLRLGNATAIGGVPDAGRRGDVWIESERSEGAFGKITLHRVAEDIAVRAVDDLTPAAPAGQAGPGMRVKKSGAGLCLPPDSEAYQRTGKFRPFNGVEACLASGGRLPEGYQRTARSVAGGAPDASGQAGGAAADDGIVEWIRLAPETTRAFRRARAAESFAFFVAGGAEMVDRLGSGAACLDGVCQVNRAASSDLDSLKAALGGSLALPTPAEPAGPAGPAASAGPGAAGTDALEAGADADRGGALTALDGVDAGIAAGLAGAGYARIADLARLGDAEIAALARDAGIPPELVRYIHEQARIMQGVSRRARQNLGMDSAPRP